MVFTPPGAARSSSKTVTGAPPRKIQTFNHETVVGAGVHLINTLLEQRARARPISPLWSRPTRRLC